MITDGYVHVGTGQYYRVGAASLLKEMDRCGVQRCFICPGDSDAASNPAGANRRLARLKERYPGRFLVWAAANPWLGRKAVRGVAEARKMGCDGLALNGWLHGYRVSDDIVTPVVEAAREFGWPVYVHTGTPISSEPLQLAHLARRFPDMRFVMGHCGHSDFWYDVLPVLECCPNIVSDSCLAAATVLQGALKRFGASRLFFSSAFPVGSMEVELGKVRSLICSGPELETVFSGTVETLCGRRV